MAHSDVVPADRSQWTVDPFSAEIRDGLLYGRGAQDDKSLLAAELAVFVDLKRTGAKLDRDVILLSEADEEAGSTGIQWLIANAWDKINAQFAVNEGGFAITTGSGQRIYEIQPPKNPHARDFGREGHRRTRLAAQRRQPGGSPGPRHHARGRSRSARASQHNHAPLSARDCETPGLSMARAPALPARKYFDRQRCGQPDPRARP
jgi:acetylornithine deacetylase/succinyl-diaminopimelate desuccinylase-like protein